MTKYIIDSYAWIEYLEGTLQGEKVRAIVSDPPNEIYTCSIIVAEIISKALRTNKKNIYLTALQVIQRISYIIDIDFELAKRAGEIHAVERKKIGDFGLVDAFLLAAANKTKAKIVTGDPHFKSRKNVVFLE